MDSKLLFSSASYVWGLHSMCRLHRIPFAPNVVLQQIPPPYSLLSFQQAAQAIGLRSALPSEPYSMIPSREVKGEGAIEIRHLSFPYPYRDLSFPVKRGVCIAIMGRSGSGKSTLARLLQGFHLPQDLVPFLPSRIVWHLS